MEQKLGQIAYEAYCEYSEWKSLVSGASLPQWDAQDDRIKNAWTAAAKKVLQEVLGIE